MATTRNYSKNDSLTGISWHSPMLILSMVLHASIFLVFMFTPDLFPTKRIDGVVYQVDIVSAPSSGKKTLKSKKSKRKSLAKKSTRTKRIRSVTKKKKSIVIAKNTITKKKTSLKKQTLTSSQMIDQAIEKIKTKSKSDDSLIDQAIERIKQKNPDDTHLDNAIAGVQKKSGGKTGYGYSGTSMKMMLYESEITDWIKSNWSYPVAMSNKKKLVAIVIVTAKRDGTVTKSIMKTRSSSHIFDESVLKAIEKSNPLPPFPEGIKKSYEEIEINFNIDDLKTR